MPCNSDYPVQSAHQALLQRTARLYGHALSHLGRRVPSQVTEAAAEEYCEADFVPDLCKLLRDLKLRSVKDFDDLVYNARSKISRDLADWWEEHESADVERERREQEEKAWAELSRLALSKLTSAEAVALGLELSAADHKLLKSSKAVKKPS